MGRDGGRRYDGLKPLFWQNDKHESKVISARSIYRLIYAWHRTITRPTAISRFALVFYNPVNSREDDAASRNSSILENSLRILSPDSLSLLSNYRFLADPPPSRIQHASHAFYFPRIFLSPFPSKSPLFPPRPTVTYHVLRRLGHIVGNRCYPTPPPPFADPSCSRSRQPSFVSGPSSPSSSLTCSSSSSFSSFSSSFRPPLRKGHRSNSFSFHDFRMIFESSEYQSGRVTRSKILSSREKTGAIWVASHRSAGPTQVVLHRDRVHPRERRVERATNGRSEETKTDEVELFARHALGSCFVYPP